MALTENSKTMLYIYLRFLNFQNIYQRYYNIERFGVLHTSTQTNNVSLQTK